MARTPPDAWARALKLLAARERTEGELKKALLSREHTEAEVDDALHRLKALKYLDDARVALARAQRLFAEGRSHADVERRLLAAGLDEGTTRGALEHVEAALHVDDRATAHALLKKRRLSGPRAARFLLGRGFDEELVRELVKVEAEGES